jgi:2-oxoglutarate ferredoxin oxidoreductase subunit delta
MKKKRGLAINRECCKGCGICVAFCPREVLVLDEEGKACWAHPKKCKNCGLCELRCPDVAVELE